MGIENVDALAGRAAELAARWGLAVGEPLVLPGPNFVAPATRADGTRVMLKVPADLDEAAHEIAALRLWHGRAAVHVLEAAPDLGGLLLERIEPGTLLSEIEQDDDAAVRVAANLLQQLWIPLPADHGLRTLESWCAAYERNRAAIMCGAPGLPRNLFERADACRRELLDSSPHSVVLHGDLHHFNILRADRARWLAIDPKGLAGDPCFDVCQYLLNPTFPMPADVNRRRLDVFCAELDLDRARTKQWALVHAVLNACWAFEDGTPDLARRVAYALSTLEF
jgi:streptomycin 6-kinase